MLPDAFVVEPFGLRLSEVQQVWDATPVQSFELGEIETTPASTARLAAVVPPATTGPLQGICQKVHTDLGWSWLTKAGEDRIVDVVVPKRATSAVVRAQPASTQRSVLIADLVAGLVKR